MRACGPTKEPLTVNVANLPADTFMGNPNLDPRATVLNVSSDKTYGRSGLLVDGSADFEYEADFAELLSYSVSFFQLSGSLGSNRSISARIAETDTVDQDVADMLPQITDVTVDAADPLRPIINYSGPTGDAAVGFFSYGADADQVVWTVLHDPAASVQLPALPAELASSWAPAAAADVSGEISVFDNTTSNGYADVRQTGSPAGSFDFAGDGSRSERTTSFIVPANATARTRLLERVASRSNTATY